MLKSHFFVCKGDTMASTRQGVVVIQWLTYKTATWEAFSEQWVLSQVRNAIGVLRTSRNKCLYSSL